MYTFSFLHQGHIYFSNISCYLNIYFIHLILCSNYYCIGQKSLINYDLIWYYIILGEVPTTESSSTSFDICLCWLAPWRQPCCPNPSSAANHIPLQRISTSHLRICGQLLHGLWYTWFILDQLMLYFNSQK